VVGSLLRANHGRGVVFAVTPKCEMARALLRCCVSVCDYCIGLRECSLSNMAGSSRRRK
jgi:hypothetical protein